MTPLAVGDRVRLKPAHNWLTRYAPLAANGRVGTITAIGSETSACVEFDTVRPGARPIAGTFSLDALVIVNVPKVEQFDAFSRAIELAEEPGHDA